jgi:hypothetical protein
MTEVGTAHMIAIPTMNIRAAVSTMLLIFRSFLTRIIYDTVPRKYLTSGGSHMRYVALFTAVVIVLIVSAAPSVAHHSFAAEYDANKPITLTGKVTKVEWQNPHTYFYVDVKDAKTNEVANWAIELGSPNSLMRLGWTRNSMKIDEMVTIQGSLAKDGSKLVNARSVALASTGQRLLTGSSEDQAK